MGQRQDELIEKAVSVPFLRVGADRVLVAHKAEGSRVFDVDNVEVIELKAQDLLKAEPTVERTYYWYRSDLDQVLGR